MGSRRSSRRASSRSSRHDTYESSMSQKLSDIERDIREEERRRRRIKRRRKRHNKIQPILEPISSTMAASQEGRQRQLRVRRRHRSDSSDLSQVSAQRAKVAIHRNGQNENPSLGSSNILSESVATGNSNSISELELPPSQVPDLSMFTASSLLPVMENKGNSSNNASVNNTANLKGANPSPSGSFRKGRRREVRLEMTETSFYQEDNDNIEIGGNKTVHTQENCQESGEVGQNLAELGPLVTEIFEQARANSSGSRNSGQREPMGSSRLGTASSRGSKGSRGSRGSQPNIRDLKYSNTKVKVPEKHGTELNRKRPFSGDYILHRNGSKRDVPVRKSQSQPGSRVSSATSHKRQIGNNGRIAFGDGLSWSRFLHAKGHTPGQILAPPTSEMFSMNKSGFVGDSSGQLKTLGTGQTKSAGIDILNVETEHKKLPYHEQYPSRLPQYFWQNGRVNVRDFNSDLAECNVLNVEQEQKQNLVKALAKKTKQKHGIGNVDVLNIEGNEAQVNILDIAEEHKCLPCNFNHPGSASSGTKSNENSSANSKHSRHRAIVGSGRDPDYGVYDTVTVLPGVEHEPCVYDLVDYDLDDEYTGSEFTDDLTDTYTYTSYDDDLTEVSSLPC